MNRDIALGLSTIFAGELIVKTCLGLYDWHCKRSKEFSNIEYLFGYLLFGAFGRGISFLGGGITIAAIIKLLTK